MMTKAASATKEHPIIFDAKSVPAIKSGQKTQTRRVMKHFSQGCPHGEPGDYLWVRETWSQLDSGFRPTDERDPELLVVYKSDHLTGNDGPGFVKWRSPMFMPRWASRYTLLIESVCIEELCYPG